MIKPRTVLTVAATMFASFTFSDAFASVSNKRCNLAGAGVLTSSEYAILFRQGGTTYGCLKSRGRRVALGSYSDASYFEKGGQRNATLGGRFVAFEDFRLGQDGSFYLVRVIDLRTGRLIKSLPTGPVSPNNDSIKQAVGLGPTTRVRVRATGAVAWIARDPYVTPTRYEVRRGADGGSVQLDEGTAIRGSSLALNGKTLTWSNGSNRRSAPLGP